MKRPAGEWQTDVQALDGGTEVGLERTVSRNPGLGTLPASAQRELRDRRQEIGDGGSVLHRSRKLSSPVTCSCVDGRTCAW